MELKEMQELWEAQPITKYPETAIRAMVMKKSTPVLTKIKRQLLFEAALWILLLAVYYNIFDGAKKPLAVNLVFVAGFVQAIVYNLSCYLAARNLVQGENLVVSLSAYIKTLKKSQLISLLSRLVLVAAMVFFFSYGLAINSKRILSIGVIVLVFAVQLYLTYQHWQKRISLLNNAVDSFRAEA